MFPLIAQVVSLSIPYAILTETLETQKDEQTFADTTKETAHEELRGVYAVHADVGLNAGSYSVGAGGAITVRAHWLQVGVAFDGASQILGRSIAGGGALVGVALVDGPRMYHVLGELGVHQEDNGAGGFSGPFSGTPSTLPHAGVRAGVDWSLGTKSAVVGTFGVYAFLRAPLYTASKTSTYTVGRDCVDANCRTYNATDREEYGKFVDAGVALRIGFDMIPRAHQTGNRHR